MLFALVEAMVCVSNRKAKVSGWCLICKSLAPNRRGLNLSSEMICAAMDDRRFTGDKRLCWIAFADNDGICSPASVARWTGRTDGRARELIEWFRAKGFVRSVDGVDVCHEFSPCHGYREDQPRPVNKKRETVMKKYGGICAYCGDASGPFQIDHIMPKSRGGSNAMDNLAWSCAKCNSEKGAMTPEEWRAGR